ncbi:MAG: outer membrane protein assembly factor BamA [bacterium]|nr:outer membrane protein assembly factor BamA [bacterium]MDT8395627.1 outer membrane protein assembly factor BamA [bacterium]
MSVGNVLAARAAGVPVVREIRVEGNQRVDASSIKGTLSFSAGDPFQDALVTRSVKDLYRLGTFSRVSIEEEAGEEGVILTVRVEEFPMIRRVLISGNKEISEADLKKVLKLKAFSFADPAGIPADVEAIKGVYRASGYHGVVVTAGLEEVEGGAVVKYLVEESEKSLIHEVDIIGNRFVEDHEIRKVMQTREIGPLSFMSDAGGYDDLRMADDLKRIQLLYMEKGFLDIVVHDPEVRVHPEGQGMYIAIRVEEGPEYKLGETKFTGDWDGPPEFTRSRPSIQTGDIFVRSGIFQDMRMYEDSFRDQGYAWARIEPLFNRDPSTGVVNLDLVLARGPLVHIRWIHVAGNVKTRDYVIRREMRLVEGDLYSQKGLDDSKKFIRGLGFFSKVEIRPADVGDGLADVHVTVGEGTAGSLSAGAAYSSVSGLVGTLQLALGNFSGRGQRLNLNIEAGGDSSTYSISFSEPRLFSGVFSLGVDLFDKTNEYTQYSQNSRGGSVRLGYRLDDFSNLSARYKYVDYDVYDIALDASALILEQEGESTTSSVHLGYNYDSRDFPMDPREGFKLSLSTEFAGGPLGGTNDFVRYQAEGSMYNPIAGDLVGLAHLELGVIEPYGDSEVPVTERFFLGGLYTIRGFEYRKVGPLEDGEPVGGTKSILMNLEAAYPLIRDANIKGMLFLDGGNVWAEDEKVEGRDLRFGAGFGFRWSAPIGLLRLEWGFNLDPKPDETQPGWEFSIGTLF